MKANQATYPVRRVCGLLGVSPSGYYAWLNRGPSIRERADRLLRDRIVDIHSRSRGTYGVPRVHAELAADGESVGRKRVARLMRQAHIQGVHRRRKVSTTRRNPAQAAAPDLVCREFTADGPDRIWVADITYIPTKAGFLYLAAVIDIWSRRVVGVVHARRPGHPVGHRRPGHGHHPPPTRPGHPPLGSRKPRRIQLVVATLGDEGGSW